VGMPGPLELGIIAVIVVLVFGVGKLSGIGKALGTSIKEFKDSVSPDDASPPPTGAEVPPKDGGFRASEKTEKPE
jgi:TatA/E family protein of Tat protein translocase